MIPCRECGKEISEDIPICPYCGTPKNPNIPKYPTFGGSGWIMNLLGVLFIVLIVGMLVTMFTFQD